MFEYLEQRLQSADFEIAGWIIVLFKIHNSRRPLIVIDPSLVDVDLYEGLGVELWQAVQPRAPPRQSETGWRGKAPHRGCATC